MNHFLHWSTEWCSNVASRQPISACCFLIVILEPFFLLSVSGRRIPSRASSQKLAWRSATLTHLNYMRHSPYAIPLLLSAFFVTETIFCVKPRNCLLLWAREGGGLVQGRHLGGAGEGHLPPWFWKIVTFLCFCLQNFIFFIFCPPPPLGSGSKFPPPWKKLKCRPWIGGMGNNLDLIQMLLRRLVIFLNI